MDRCTEIQQQMHYCDRMTRFLWKFQQDVMDMVGLDLDIDQLEDELREHRGKLEEELAREDALEAEEDEKWLNRWYAQTR